jgi:hypothetical protein
MIFSEIGIPVQICRVFMREGNGFAYRWSSPAAWERETHPEALDRMSR